MTIRSMKYYFDHPRTLLIILTITILTLGLSLGLTSLQTSTKAASAQASQVRVGGQIVCAGGNATVPNVSIALDSVGTENRVSFTLNFDPNLTVVDAMPGSDAAGASFSYSSAGGSLVADLQLPGSQVFNAGSQQIVTITFAAPATAPSGPSPLNFNPSSQVFDASANPITANFNSGTINVRRPSLVARVLPDTVNAGRQTPLTIRINGFDFVPGTKVSLRVDPLTERPLNIESLSSTDISATVLPTDLVVGSNAQVVVVSPGPCSSQSIKDFTIINPAPGIGSVTPNLTNVGSGVDVTVNGTNFVLTSKAFFNGQQLVTTYSGGKLIANIPADKVTTAGVGNITVSTPVPGGGTSDSLPFTVNNLVPGLTTLSPTTRLATDAGFTLTLNGSNFVNTSVVRWNGADRPTTFVSATKLTAVISAADVASPGTPSITVVNPAPGGGPSNALTFTIAQPPLAPTITSLNPGFAIVGDQQFILTVNGLNFASNSVVRLNNSDR